MAAAARASTSCMVMVAPIDHSELFERRAVLDHALLDAKALPLEGTKQLFDIPSTMPLIN